MLSAGAVMKSRAFLLIVPPVVLAAMAAWPAASPGAFQDAIAAVASSGSVVMLVQDGKTGQTGYLEVPL